MTVKRHPTRGDNLRRALAQEAARIMAEHGIGDFLVAKRKAAERLGVEDGAAMLPKNSEIEAALAEYQRLFGGDIARRRRSPRSAARRCRRCATCRSSSRAWWARCCRAPPREHSEVQLHLFTDRAESVTLKLLDEGIPHEVTEKRVKLEPGAGARLPRRALRGRRPVDRGHGISHRRHPPGACEPGRRAADAARQRLRGRGAARRCLRRLSAS